MSFPYSYSVLGLVPGLILTVVVAVLVLYTSLIVWEFCMRHPEVRDVCDLGQMLFWNWKWAWWFTAVMFLLNNTFIQVLNPIPGNIWCLPCIGFARSRRRNGSSLIISFLHLQYLTMGQYLNTMTNNTFVCTVGFSGIMAIISWICSLPRTFDTLSKLGTLSAFFTFISVLLAAIFAAIEGLPAGYTPDPAKGGGPPIVLVIPAAGTDFVSGLSAFLNISYTFIGQITLPSFIAEMKKPEDFPKALWAVTIAEIILFSVIGAVIYG